MRMTDNKQNKWAEYMICYSVTNAKKKKMYLVVSGLGTAILYEVATEDWIIWSMFWKKGKHPAMLTSRDRALHAEQKLKQEHVAWGRGQVGDE